MYLHENPEMFRNLVSNAAQYYGTENAIVEKDYYVTLILRMLANAHENCVFKGGTSLSKGFQLIDRFSEDIDITFEEHLGNKKRKRLKHETIQSISDELMLPIENWDKTESNKDLNAYYFQYQSVFQMDSGSFSDVVPEYVKVETSLGSSAFPTEIHMIGSYVGNYLVDRGRPDLMAEFSLDEFPMKLQSVDRTYIDKIFATCDYYINGISNKRSRHLYDIYKLTPMVSFNNEFIKLFEQVRAQRKEMNERARNHNRKLICPSAEMDVIIPDIIRSYCKDDFYKKDYYEITGHFIRESIAYEDIVAQMLEVAEEIENVTNTDYRR